MYVIYVNPLRIRVDGTKVDGYILENMIELNIQQYFLLIKNMIERFVELVILLR